jgi:hypothetical protein
MLHGTSPGLWAGQRVINKRDVPIETLRLTISHYESPEIAIKGDRLGRMRVFVPHGCYAFSQLNRPADHLIATRPEMHTAFSGNILTDEVCKSKGWRWRRGRAPTLRRSRGLKAIDQAADKP